MLGLIREKWFEVCSFPVVARVILSRRRITKKRHPNRSTKITWWKFKQDILFVLKSMIKLKWDITIMINRMYNGLRSPYIKQLTNNDAELIRVRKSHLEIYLCDW
jgi:hypothetical protein